ncbi:MAG: PDZ domain-containing protein [Anaerolineae bacterium]|nr:MAG: PDZ domain-containing protein [Anaerolineae bacterium]
MNKRRVTVLALAAFALALGVGAVTGGGLVYTLTRLGGGAVPVAKAQMADPGYGIVIASVLEDGPAEKAGVVRGDILLEIDGRELEGPSNLRRMLDDLAPGDKVELTVLHGDEQRTLVTTLGEREGRAYLGLNFCGSVPEAVGVQWGAPGALVVGVVHDSPAEEAGLQEGDTILAVDAQELEAEDDLADLISEHEPGDTVTLEVQRPGDKESLEVTVKLGQHPDDEDKAYLGVKYWPFPHFDVLPHRVLPFGELDGFKFDELPFVLPDDKVQQGAIVQQVVEDSPASVAGLQKGDVIVAIDGKVVESPQMLGDAITEHEPGDKVVLTVCRRGEEEILELEVALGEHPDEDGKAYLGVVLGGFFRVERFGGDESEGPRRFRFFRPPLDFDFELPFEDLPFDPDEWPRRFKFDWHWPHEGDDVDLPGWLGKGV